MLSNPIGTVTELATGRGRERFTAPVGFNQKLFKGALWMLQLQGFLTVGSGNAALTVVARGQLAPKLEVQQQDGASQSLTHTYVGQTLVVKLGTDAGSVGNTTAKAAVAYLKAQAGLQADFLDFIAGGDGTGVMIIAAQQVFPMLNCWIRAYDAANLPSSVAPVCAARGEGDNNGQSFIDNTGGLPGAVSASAEQGVWRLRNESLSPITRVFQDCGVADDDAVTADPAKPRVGLCVAFFPDGSVAVDTMR